MGAIAKLSSQNELTLPEWAVEELGHPSHVEISIEGNRLVLTPTRHITAEQVFEKLDGLGLRDSDVEDAVAWARRPDQAG